jgi:hypothetical protein
VYLQVQYTSQLLGLPWCKCSMYIDYRAGGRIQCRISTCCRVALQDAAAGQGKVRRGKGAGKGAGCSPEATDDSAGLHLTIHLGLCWHFDSNQAPWWGQQVILRIPPADKCTLVHTLHPE